MQALKNALLCGGIAQLARAFGSYPECRRFESHCRYQFYNKECAITCPPLSYIRPGGQAVKTPPFHGGNTGSSPVRVTKKERSKGFVLFLSKPQAWHIITHQRVYHRRRRISSAEGCISCTLMIYNATH